MHLSCVQDCIRMTLDSEGQCSRRKGERNAQIVVGLGLSITNEQPIVEMNFWFTVQRLYRLCVAAHRVGPHMEARVLNGEVYG